MAKKKGINFFKYERPPKKKRKGIHSKNLSRSKGSKQYKKPYRSQGKTR